ncbi:hypothetical protein NON20_16070 [Synechocystis sp. B12]|nr:hypothetical protein NON20_16070 [Synechocystis sp. B12]
MGCNNISINSSQNKISRELQESAALSVKYGDYYMKEFSDLESETTYEPLKIGSDLIKEQVDISGDYSRKNLPLLEPEAAKANQDCLQSIGGYWAVYSGLSGTYSTMKLIGGNKDDFTKQWDNVLDVRNEVTNKCDL